MYILYNKMALYLKPYAINQAFNTKDYLLNDTKLTKREGNILFVQKALEGASWADFLEYVRDTYGIQFSLTIGLNYTVITIIEDVDLKINLIDKVGSANLNINNCIISRTNLTATQSIFASQFIGDLTGTSGTSFTSPTATNYTPPSGIDTSIYNFNYTGGTTFTFKNNVSVASAILSVLSTTFLDITNTCALTDLNTIKTITGTAPTINWFSNDITQLYSNPDEYLNVYIYDDSSVHNNIPYNYLGLGNFQTIQKTKPFAYFGQYDDRKYDIGSNDRPFLRVDTNSNTSQFCTISFGSSSDRASLTRGVIIQQLRYDILRWTYSFYSGSTQEAFMCSFYDTQRIDIHYASIKYVRCEKGFTVNGAKTFEIIHPKDETKKLRHACVEGSEVKNIYRDTVNVSGSCIINLDEHFNMTTGTITALNKNMSVSLCNNATFDNVIGYLEGSILHIEVETDEPTTISFIVFGTRQDDAIKRSSCVDENGDLITEFYSKNDNE